MSERRFFARAGAAFRGVPLGRLIVVLLIPLAAALASDWLRAERVIFPAPLPKFTTVPAHP